jgi:hypothetical protein
VIAADRIEICSELISLLSSFIIIPSNESLLIFILYTFFAAPEHDQPLFCILFPNNYASSSLLLNSLPG